MQTITEVHPDFKSFERILYTIMCQIACELIRQYLEWRDCSIMALRDTKSYRLIDKRETTIKTMMGEVRFSRRYYRNSNGQYVFLLDESMGFDCGCGLVSENLAEQIVNECTDKSFRKASKSISTLTGQCISRMGVWNVLQNYAETIEQQEQRLKELDESGQNGCLGNISSKVLFEEYDDVWINLQRQNRQKHSNPTSDRQKKAGKYPMHVGTAYTGWSQAKDGRYNTVNKIAYASFGKANEFVSKFETLLRHYIDVDGVEHRITGGDGEAWIKTTAAQNDSVLQLDPYHRSQAIVKAVKDKSDRQMLFDSVKKKDVDEVLDTICDLFMKTTDEPTWKKLSELYNYFSNNRDSFLTWQERGIKLPEAPAGITYRSLGVQESSNCSLLTQRMKHRKGSWSKDGATHMAKILCFKNTIGLDTILCPLPEPPMCQPSSAPLSAARTPQNDGKGYGADWLYAQMPFEKAFKTNGREAIRNMLRLKSLSTLPFLSGS